MTKPGRTPTGTTIFRLALVPAWVAIVVVTIVALITPEGLSGGKVFFTDFGQPWRRQINADFVIHLLLIMAWIAYREPTRARRLILPIFALLGSVFLLPYIFAATIGSRGRIDGLLMGSGHIEKQLRWCAGIVHG